MTQSEWLSYDDSGQGGAPIVVDFDAAFEDRALRPPYAHRVDVTVRGFPVDANGLPTDAAEDQLYAVEQRLEEILDGSGAIAASVAGASAFVWYVYAADASRDADLEGAARKAGLDATSSGAPDEQWTQYARWALVGEELERARDCAQLEALSDEGVDLETEHRIDFAYAFADEPAANKARDALIEAGIAGVSEYGTYGDIEVASSLVPSPEAIAAERVRLGAILVPRGGVYAGWGIDADE